MLLFASIVLLAAVNLCLGYALAVGLGCGPPSFKTAWEALSAEQPAVATADSDDQPGETPGIELPGIATDSAVAEQMDRHFGVFSDSGNVASQSGSSRAGTAG